MECNRDEALRSKVLAEAKLSQCDYMGARKFAYKAKQLYPDLDGLAQLIFVVDVHNVAQNKLPNGDYNWYDILEVDPLADENTIRKQYRRLALLLHPDKNKAVGAEAAFKHISEAWNVLSDKNKKAAYDAKSQGKVPPPGGRPSQPDCMSDNTSRPAPTTGPAPVPPSQRRVQVQQGQSAGSRPPSPVPAPATGPSPAPPPQRRVQVGQAQTIGSCPSSPAPAPAKPYPPCPPSSTSAASSQSRLHSPAFTSFTPNSLTFWTACPSCKMLLEYQRMYCLKNLCCPVCYKPFSAIEVTAVTGTLLWPPPSKQRIFGSKTFSPAANSGFQVPQAESFPFGNVKGGNTVYPSSVPGVDTAQKANEDMSQKLPPELREKVEERISRQCAAFEGLEVKEPKKKVAKKMSKAELKAKADADAKEASNVLMARFKGMIEQRLSAEKQKNLKSDVAAPEVDIKSETCPRQTAASDSTNCHANPQNGLPTQQLSVKCKSSSTGSPNTGSDNTSKRKREAVNEAIPSSDSKEASSPSSKKIKHNEESKLTSDVGCAQVKETNKLPQVEDSREGKVCPEACVQASSLHLNTESQPAEDRDAISVTNPITVPDPEFFEFGKDHVFLPGQIWAVYDDKDGMPRFYAKVNKIITSKPFKMDISWLEPSSTVDQACTWLNFGFALSCGEFKIGKSIVSDSVNMYSHVVKFERGKIGDFKIYPRQGDIWALHKKLEGQKTKDENPRFMIVEVLSDFKDEGVQVLQLVKLEGYKSLFQRHPEGGYSEWIPASDMRRFSHQIPSYHLASDEVPGIKEGCWELDSASTPLELIS
ncbi:hypothetical protein KP509_07G063900 [Ceratopteris richardii]|uniref:J domain-containing protein n=1 Tax=Ceratopteris richardii TaxID=49495 RepID=A0A8T2UBL4_CERRI|nr:hypothetical protein KP509_07G063900 [Ceratopteris richardii]KAH7433326.1 hypothetical protein KP509_07G063900 [Ceratopteris richardii]KAH7433327.1 hypothetical protein KP509_07G063900 [Ceratopteris richardii]